MVFSKHGEKKKYLSLTDIYSQQRSHKWGGIENKFRIEAETSNQNCYKQQSYSVIMRCKNITRPKISRRNYISKPAYKK